MCTVTYLPYRSGFILTHNRDEAPTRSPKEISREKIGDDILLYPRDTKAGGAWIVAAGSGKTACLLNGAFIKHTHEPPYRQSRGLLLLDFFKWPEPDDFFNRYVLDGIEPFTFLFFQPGTVCEFRWDGAQRYLKTLSATEPHFWCSPTLYPPEMQAKRENIFQNWLANNTRPDASSNILPRTIYRLHLTGSLGDPENDYVMNRGNRVQTVSVTQVVCEAGVARMRYHDLLEAHRDLRQISRKARTDGPRLRKERE